jgi:hypothetical protein
MGHPQRPVARGLPRLRRPLLDASTSDRLLMLACPGCGYRATWHAADPDDTNPGKGDLADPDYLEAE